MPWSLDKFPGLRVVALGLGAGGKLVIDPDALLLAEVAEGLVRHRVLVAGVRQLLIDLPGDGGRLPLQFLALLTLAHRGSLDDGWGQELVPVHGPLRQAEVIREELVEFALGEGVEFVVVAGRAAGGEAEPDGRGGLYPVDRVANIVFIVDRAALAGGYITAVEAGGDLLVKRRPG